MGAVTLVMAANVFNIGADLGSMASAIRLLVPVPFVVLIVGITIGMLVLEVRVPYRSYRKILRWLTLSLLAYVAVLFVVDVDWADVLRHTFIPTMTWDRSHIAALIAILGTTISPYLFFWQTSEEVEEMEESGAEGTSTPLDVGHLRHMRQDILTGMATAVIVMFSIMVAAGATLGKQGVTTIQTADQAAQALKPIAGHFARSCSPSGSWAPASSPCPCSRDRRAYAIAEAIDQPEGLSKPFRGARGFYIIIGSAMLLGLILNFAGLNPVRALYFLAILNGLAAPPLIFIMLLLSRSSATCGQSTGGKLSVALMATTFLVMAGLPIVYLFLA